jgi:hypothetical protein
MYEWLCVLMMGERRGRTHAPQSLFVVERGLCVGRHCQKVLTAECSDLPHHDRDMQHVVNENSVEIDG